VEEVDREPDLRCREHQPQWGLPADRHASQLWCCSHSARSNFTIYNRPDVVRSRQSLSITTTSLTRRATESQNS